MCTELLPRMLKDLKRPLPEERRKAMGNILITASHFDTLCRDAVDLLEDHGHHVILNDHDMPYYSFDELAVWAPDIDGAIIGMDTWDENIFKIAPKLKILARFGVGVDNIDLEAAKNHGVKVVNAAGMNASAVAELCVTMMLNCLRSLPLLNREMLSGNWPRLVGYELGGRTVGLIGLGDIGGRVAKMLSGFGVRLIAYDPYQSRERAEAMNVSILDDMEDVLAQSDIVSIHIPSTPATRHIMNRESFSRMKQGAYFINTARGALVDTKALIEAVSSGHLAGAAIDVFENEPLPAGDPVLRVPNIQCYPHAGAETKETYDKISIMAAHAIIDTLEGREPVNWINK